LAKLMSPAAKLWMAVEDDLACGVMARGVAPFVVSEAFLRNVGF
jgi:hypothetical protein